MVASQTQDQVVKEHFFKLIKKTFFDQISMVNW
jgi:hypothetical protein